MCPPIHYSISPLFLLGAVAVELGVDDGGHGLGVQAPAQEAVDLPGPLEGQNADFLQVIEHYKKNSKSKSPVIPIGMKIKRRNGAELPREDGMPPANGSYIVVVNPQVEDFGEKCHIKKFEEGDRVLVLADEDPS